ncbi:SHOCT domain-containing protein [Halomicroarcula sp. F13]|jgi:putative membrane protein|uniref:SHOCT domain-containing protein n=3 Tax=Halobacteriales TaxID=2235 RepID=A0A9Q4L6H7_9EURY|nr:MULTISPECIES: SHOCT domain-containing protein [Halobacteria]MBX0325007.1 SHOCT domain-containing protein [Halomicroarcula rubra]MDF9748174.1 SHOCT domain-containing protein [Natrinema salsiterrestre]MDT3437495.1 SHOCT domain-containing protein [Haloarcula sp. 1CSR25-25]SFG95038.1 putative membrane protein [Halopelagius inordinatus]
MSTERTSDGLLRIVLIVLAVIVLFPMLMMVFAAPMMGMMGWWWGGGTAGGLSPLWGIGMMLVWLVVLVGIGYLLYRGLVGGVGSSLTTDRALEELRVAYARGDLSDEEFEERRAKLTREESQ